MIMMVMMIIMMMMSIFFEYLLYQALLKRLDIYCFIKFSQ